MKKYLDAQKLFYEKALLEIKGGRKKTHWMWFVFPQIEGLGFSENSKLYALKNIKEAEEFFNHPVLGKRLVKISKELLKLKTNNPEEVFSFTDSLKLKSSMTLFSFLKNTDIVFKKVLEKFFNGEGDEKTLEIIKRT
jgi:uncharacterized protein (DUF1810 family)